MQLVTGRDRIAAVLGRPLRAPAVAIGNFDGVHRGHQALVGRARALAEPRGGDVVALTFDPPPARLFAPRWAPSLLVTLSRRAELLGQAGATVVIAEPFTRAFADLSDEAFVDAVLVGDLGARDVVVGYDFTFGRGRAGDVDRLRALGPDRGLGVEIVPAVREGGVVCSSTRIRELVLEGKVEGAAVLLGRPVEVTGEVVRGAGRGRELGFPTANLRPEAEMLPRTGIYTARTVLLDEPERPPVPTALSIGTNPTFEAGRPVTVEAYLLRWDRDLYGRRVRVELGRRLRDERRFATTAELVEQIRGDVAEAERFT